jgi:hypothetical protein
MIADDKPMEEGYDLVVRAGTIDDSGLMFHRLGELPRCAFSAHLVRGRRPLRRSKALRR